MAQSGMIRTEAEEQLRQKIVEGSQDPEDYRRLTDLLFPSGRYDEAIALYKQALTLPLVTPSKRAQSPNVRIDVACGKKWKAGREREKGSESTTNGRVSQGGGTKVSESGVAVGGGSGAGVGSIELVSLSMEQALW
jgi:hypothetical protein